MSILTDLLDTAQKHGASDLLIMVGDAPAMRVSGQWIRFDLPICKDAFVVPIAEELIGPDAISQLEKNHELDFSRSLQPVGRVRCNVHYQRNHIAMVLRLVWPVIPDPTTLGIPAHVINMSDYPHGLILLSGPTGSGKSTTLAAMVEHINQTRPAHIITIEDPIEYIYANKKSIIEQREIGSDTQSWHSALRTVLRQAPDVIVLGELRDLESIATALVAAETGHLVLTSVHSSTAAGAISRIVDAFPPAQSGQARLQLSQSIRMVFGQRLVPGRQAKRRILSYEILMGTPAVANMIRTNQLEQIPNAISAGRDHGMISFTQCQRDMLAQGLVAPEIQMAGH